MLQKICRMCYSHVEVLNILLLHSIISRNGRQLQVCSAKKRDNLLVEADIIYHFKDTILCNAKHLQFYRNLKNRVAQFSKLSIQICCHFFNLMRLLVTFVSQKNMIATAPLLF